MRQRARATSSNIICVPTPSSCQLSQRVYVAAACKAQGFGLRKMASLDEHELLERALEKPGGAGEEEERRAKKERKEKRRRERSRSRSRSRERERERSRDRSRDRDRGGERRRQERGRRVGWPRL